VELQLPKLRNTTTTHITTSRSRRRLGGVVSRLASLVDMPEEMALSEIESRSFSYNRRSGMTASFERWVPNVWKCTSLYLPGIGVKWSEPGRRGLAEMVGLNPVATNPAGSWPSDKIIVLPLVVLVSREDGVLVRISRDLSGRGMG